MDDCHRTFFRADTAVAACGMDRIDGVFSILIVIHCGSVGLSSVGLGLIGLIWVLGSVSVLCRLRGRASARSE